MALFDLYIDVVGNALVKGPTSREPADFPTLYGGDTPTFNIYLLKRTSQHPFGREPFEVVNLSGLSLKVAIGTKTGSTIYANQYTWTADAANQYFTGALALNTTGIETTLLGSNTSAKAWFEVETTESGYPTTVLQKEVTIQSGVIDPASLVVPPGATAMTAEEANASFLKRTIVGAFYLVSPDGSKTVAIHVDNDGLFHADPVT